MNLGMRSNPTLASVKESIFFMSVYDQLQALNITLPVLGAPAGAYLPFVQTGNFGLF